MSALKNVASMRPCTRAWLVLLGLTLFTYGIGSMGMSGIAAAGVVLLATLLKGQVVVDHFMGLRHVRPFWRVLMFSYLAVVGVAIAIAYVLGVN